MKIGIDGTTICDAAGRRGAGIEHYTWSIIYWMARVAPEHEFFVTVPSHFSLQESEVFAPLTNVHLLRPLLPKVSFLSRHVGIPTRLLSKHVDVFFGPAGQLPLGWRKRGVVTIHDLSIFDHPEWFPEERVRNFSTGVLVPQSLKQADKIIAVSAFTQAQLERLFPVTRGKTLVIHEGVDVPERIPDFHQDVLATSGAEDILLAIGTIEPRKNLTHAIHAFHQFLQVHPERAASTRLILAGKHGWKTTETDRAIEEVNAVWRKEAKTDVVQAIGYVTEMQKWALLEYASALLFVSWEEGFGLPLLEALAVGTPVIASNRGSLPEIAGDVAILVEPDDVEAISLAIAQCVLVPDGARVLQEEGKRHAAKFSWERTARATVEVLESVVEQNKTEPGEEALD